MYQFKYSPNGDFILTTTDGKEVGKVYAKEDGEKIEEMGLIIAKLINEKEKLTKENDSLTEKVHELRKRNYGPTQ